MTQKPFDMMTKEELIDALLNYKKQAPEKYERDKEALFEKYNLKAKEVKADKAEEELLTLKAEVKAEEELLTLKAEVKAEAKKVK